ncbi:MAG TPA: hypothetical protein EYH40_01120 [Desulfurococcales archaeon]|nr:hypothetical protein [Desulfurococcales archaeon]
MKTLSSLRKGLSNVIAEAILLFIGVTIALLLASTLIPKMNLFQSKISIISSQMARSMSERFVFVYATFNETDSSFIIYLKNIGDYPIYSIDKATVIFGRVGSAIFYPYNASATTGSGSWKYIELGVVNDVFDPGETIEIVIYNSTNIDPPYFFKFTTANGNSVQVEFSLTPR